MRSDASSGFKICVIATFGLLLASAAFFSSAGGIHPFGGEGFEPDPDAALWPDDDEADADADEDAAEDAMPLLAEAEAAEPDAAFGLALDAGDVTGAADVGNSGESGDDDENGFRPKKTARMMTTSAHTLISLV
jgi:hypothetical protein